jgi:hypothetical protein
VAVTGERVDLRHPADILADHLRGQGPRSAAVVFDGDATATVEAMVASGWRLGPTEYVAGKRVRTMIPPTTTEQP